MQADLIATRSLVQAGALTAAQAMDESMRLAQAPAAAHAFVSERFEAERERLHHTETAHLPLAGLAVSVKDLLMWQGQVTTAGSLALQDAPAATSDAPAVARLRAAGGSIVGRTHMVEFAFSGIGTNPHFQRPPRSTTAWAPCPGQHGCPAGLPPAPQCQSPVARATQHWAQTPGGRFAFLPRSTASLVSNAQPAWSPPLAPCHCSTTLDTACAMTRSVRDAIVVHEVLAARRVTRSSAPLSAWRLAVPTHTFLDELDGTVSTAFQRTLDLLRQAGAQIESIDLPETGELGPMQAQGSLAAAESYAWHRPVLARHAEQYDPRVRSRIERGAAMSAADYIHLQHARQAWISRMEARVAGFDALLSPTVAIVPPLLSDVAPGEARDAAFFQGQRLGAAQYQRGQHAGRCAPCHCPAMCGASCPWACGLARRRA